MREEYDTGMDENDRREGHNGGGQGRVDSPLWLAFMHDCIMTLS